MRSHLWILVFFVSFTSPLLAADHYTRATGDWEGNAIWGNTTSGAGALWSTRTITAGDNIYVDDNITLNTNLSINVDVTIYVSATLTIDGQLNLTTNSKIIFTSSSGRIVGTPPGNSDKIRIGAGNSVWSTTDGNITGPGTLDKNSSNGVLPISLLFFKVASISSEGITFSWATASELNFDHFNIQVSSDGKEFRTLSEIKGNGTTKERSDYFYIDKSPMKGTSYYRLQSIDFDGYTESFNVVSATIEGARDVTIYPNPVVDSSLKFRLNFEPIHEIQVTVTSLIGVEKIRGVIQPNERDVNLDLFVEPGIYVVKISSVDYNKLSRIVVK